MKVSAKTLIQLSGIEATSEEVAQLVEEHIGAVDDTHNMEEDYKDIVIAEIKNKENHPEADKLGVYQISYGEEDIQVLAGDKNLEVGDKIAYLKPGAVVPISIYTEEKPFVIESMKMRGLMSNGMMGSARELNIGNDHTRVLVLPKEAPVGESFATYYQLDDFIIDVENKGLTNRGDLFGLIGLARELAAIKGIKYKTPDWYLEPNRSLEPENNCLELEIINDAESVCKRYCAIAMDNVEIKDSPVEIKSALIKAGIKPINNIVDVTNYFSMLVGQPLHAFDYDKILKQDPNGDNTLHINVRPARNGETILGLDDKVHEFSDRNIVIADSTHPIGIAGIMGGKDTEISQDTKRMVLECANFDKTNIRKSSMELGLFTDASTRYKHAMDTDQCLAVLCKAVEMIKDLSGATIASEIIDIKTEEMEDNIVTISLSKLNTHLGLELNRDEVSKILENLGYSITEIQEDYLTVLVPKWRKDIEIAEDIHEDIGRIYGYNNIPLVLPKREMIPVTGDRIYDTKRKIRNLLSNISCNELDTYNFTNIKTLKNAKQDPDLAYQIQNAQAQELSLMRTSILPSLLERASENSQRGIDKFAIFESNIAHHKSVVDENNLPQENWYLSWLLTSKLKDNKTSSYYTAKKYLERIAKDLNIDDIQYTLVADSLEQDLPVWIKNLIPTFDSNKSAIISVRGHFLGIIGKVDVEVLENFKLPEFTCALELNINEIVKLETLNKQYKEDSKYPAVTKDICVEMDRGMEYTTVESIIDHAINNEDLSGNVECIDIYMKDMDDEKKRITFRVDIKNYNKTLKDRDIENILKKIEKGVTGKINAQII